MSIDRSPRPDAEGTAVRKSAAGIDTVAFLFNASYVMLAFLVPLDAYHLGYSAFAIGLITGVPGFLQMPLRVLSGPLSDMYGERRLLLVSCSCGVAAGIVLGVDATGLVALLGAQLAIGAARGFYWVSAQAYVARLPGDNARLLGIFTSLNQAGSIAGIVLAGPLVTWRGYAAAFAFCGVVQGAAWLVTLILENLPPMAVGRGLAEGLRALPVLVKRRPVLVSSAANIVAAIPQALVQSFYPVDLAQIGLSATLVSALTSLRGAGVFAAGFLFAWMYRRLGTRRVCVLGTVALGCALAATASGLLPVVAGAIALAGVASGAMTILATVMVVDSGDERDRGSYLALTNLGYAGSMFITPLAFGAGAAQLGLPPTFVAVGCAVALAAAAALVAGFRKRAAHGVGAASG